MNADPTDTRYPHLDLEDLIAGAAGQPIGDRAREHLASCEHCQREANRCGAGLIGFGIARAHQTVEPSVPTQLARLATQIFAALVADHGEPDLHVGKGRQHFRGARQRTQLLDLDFLEAPIENIPRLLPARAEQRGKCVAQRERHPRLHHLHAPGRMSHGDQRGVQRLGDTAPGIDQRIVPIEKDRLGRCEPHRHAAASPATSRP